MEPSWTKSPAIVSIMKEVYETAGEIDNKAVINANAGNTKLNTVALFKGGPRRRRPRRLRTPLE